MIRLFILAAVFLCGCGSGRVRELERELEVERERSVMLNNRLYKCEKRLSVASKVCGERVGMMNRRLVVCEGEKKILGEKIGEIWRRCVREGVDLRSQFERGCAK